MIDHTLSGSQAYQKLFEVKLAEARAKNDGLGLTNDETQQLRGRIALLKELLALPEQQRLLDAQARFEHPD